MPRHFVTRMARLILLYPVSRSSRKPEKNQRVDFYFALSQKN